MTVNKAAIQVGYRKVNIATDRGKASPIGNT